jgi:hypothetical protein
MTARLTPASARAIVTRTKECSMPRPNPEPEGKPWTVTSRDEVAQKFRDLENALIDYGVGRPEDNSLDTVFSLLLALKTAFIRGRRNAD